MLLLVRIILSFASVIVVFSGIAWLNLWAADGFRRYDVQVGEHLALIDALRETENRLAAQEAVLDAYIASADPALKDEFLGVAAKTVDEAVKHAAGVAPPNSGKEAELATLASLIAEWRKAADIDMLVFQRQPLTQKARTAVRQYLGPIIAEERQAIDAASQRKDAKAAVMIKVSWGGLASALLIGALAAWWLMRTVQRPIVQLTTIVQQLAQGDFRSIVPATHRSDEIGTIARAIDAFKLSMSEAESLRAQQEVIKERASSDKRVVMNRMADEFEASVRNIAHLVASASTELQSTARSMTEIAEAAKHQAMCAQADSAQSATNSQVVATAADALALSVGDIHKQIDGSVQVAAQAVGEIEQASGQIAGLAEAADRIGSAVRLIADITKRTNTLALNATIEATRAGEAGRGFAVVAAEVRTLADQIAAATTEISGMVTKMQGATMASVDAIKHVSQTIGRISDVAGTVMLAVREQGNATAQISTNVQQAAVSTRSVSASIGEVTDAADATRTAAGQVLLASGDLSRHSEILLSEVDNFVSRIRSGGSANQIAT